MAYADFLALLQRSDVHVYLTYPFVASWSLREAMAAGCAIVGSATTPVEEFIEDGVTGRLVPFTEPDRIAEGVLELLNDTRTAKKMRQAARAEAERTLCMKAYLAEYEKLIDQLIATHKSATAPAARAASAENRTPRKGRAPKSRAGADAVKPARVVRQPATGKDAPVKGAAKKTAVRVVKPAAVAPTASHASRSASKSKPVSKPASKPAPRAVSAKAAAPARVAQAGGRRKKAARASS